MNYHYLIWHFVNSEKMAGYQKGTMMFHGKKSWTNSVVLLEAHGRESRTVYSIGEMKLKQKACLEGYYWMAVLCLPRKTQVTSTPC